MLKNNIKIAEIKDGKIAVAITCNECGQTTVLEMTKEKHREWASDNKKIQDVFPCLDKNIRELMISGMCGECFDKIFENV